MSITELIKPEMQENRSTRQIGGLKRFFIILGLALIWAFLSAMIIGSFAAGIWTLVPTAFLPWGASYENLIGYVSHCSFTPVSSFILIGVALIGSFIAYRLKRGRNIGKGVFIGTLGGLLIGLIGGIDIIMFIGMGAGVGVGVVLGLFIGIVKKTEV